MKFLNKLSCFSGFSIFLKLSEDFFKREGRVVECAFLEFYIYWNFLVSLKILKASLKIPSFVKNSKFR
jgi:hypothetical protein